MKDEEMDPTQILRARARALAQSVAKPATEGPMLELLQFNLAQEHYAIESRYVREVYPLKELTPIPCTPPFIRGVVNARGRILPVLDLKIFFELPDKGITDLHRIILVRGEDIELGLLADITTGIRSIPADHLQPSLPTLTGIRQEYLQGVTAERLIVLNLGRILADPKIIVHEEVDA
jgi:purine-binding chemotaxis protein CheW